MREVRQSSPEEMVLAFLRAEYHSPRYRGIVRKALQHDASLLHRANLDDQRQNALRRQALSACRGFQSNSYLFLGFPTDVRWVVLEATVSELSEMKYANQTALTLPLFRARPRKSASFSDHVASIDNEPALLSAGRQVL
jgi:hypothetical protein